jgi:hypothetical protein
VEHGKAAHLVSFIAAATATILTGLTDQREFEELAKRAGIVEQTNVPGAKCPLSRDVIDTADTGLLAICVSYGLVAYDAARRYPKYAAKVFAVYGEEEIFTEIFDQYGHKVIPIIASYVENGSREIEIRHALNELLLQLWVGQKPAWGAGKLTREQIGLIAIQNIAARGHEMLAEFEIVDGVAKRKPVTSLFLGMKGLLFGHAGDVEKILVRGERLPSWNEVGLAALDVSIFTGGVGVLSKVSRVGGRTAVEKSTGRVMAEGVFAGIGTSVKAGKWIAPVAILYVLIKQPELLGPFGGWVAQQFGFHRIVGIFSIYFIGVFLVFHVLRPCIWLARAIVWAFTSLRAVFVRLRPRSHSESSFVSA